VKSLNVKKIAALAGVTLLAGAGLAAATLSYGGTVLVDETGAPRVSVVVGQNAAASDGVAAGRIAAKIASAAYKTTTYTPTVTGGTCTTVGGGNTSTSGTCDVLTESVTLNFTAPGVSGAYEIEQLINDYVDRELNNRIDNSDDDQYLLNNGYDDSDEEEYNLWTDGNSGGSLARNDEPMHKIDGTEFTPFGDYTVPHPEDEDLTEKQSMWIKGYNQADTNGDIIGYVDMMAYSLKFTGNDYGLAACTEDLGDKYYGSTGCDTSDQTAEDNVKIEIGGEEWIIVDMEDPGAGGLTSDLDRIDGGSVTIAKESDRRIMQLGDTMDLGNGYQLKLTDIGVAETAENQHAALFDVIDTSTNDTIEASDLQKIFPGDTEKWTYPGTSDTVKVHVYKTTYGYELFQRWAEVAIRQEEWELVDGEELDEPNDDWTVSLVWKNKKAGNAPEDDADSLREIIFYSTEYNSDPIELSPKDTVPVFKDDDTHYYTLTYNGLATVPSIALPSKLIAIFSTFNGSAVAPVSS